MHLKEACSKAKRVSGTALDEWRCFLWMRSIARSLACASLAVLLPGLILGQAASIQIAVSTPLSIQLLHHVPMKTGEALEGRLLYPIYVENRIALPAGTILRGSVVQLDSDHGRRIHARLRGDFTPFHTCVVQFNQVVLPDGTLQPIESDRATDGVAVLHLSPPPGPKEALFPGRPGSPGKTGIERDRGSLHGTRARRSAGSIYLYPAAVSPAKDRCGNNMDG